VQFAALAGAHPVVAVDMLADTHLGRHVGPFDAVMQWVAPARDGPFGPPRPNSLNDEAAN
jgi:hypothetical protein